MKTIEVVFTAKPLKDIETNEKRYCFNTTSDIKEGDLLISSSYGNKMRVTNILKPYYKYYNTEGKIYSTLSRPGFVQIKEMKLSIDNNPFVVVDVVAESKEPQLSVDEINRLFEEAKQKYISELKKDHYSKDY